VISFGFNIVIIGSSSNSIYLRLKNFNGGRENDSVNSFFTWGSRIRSEIEEERFIEESFSSSFNEVVDVNFSIILVAVIFILQP
jgi:hypothetical protein